MKFTVRELEEVPGSECRHEELKALTRSIPFPGRLQYVIERDPDYLSFVRAIGEEGRVFVSEDDHHRVRGCTTATLFQLREQGDQIGYISDVKVDPAARGGRQSEALMKTCVEWLRNSQSRMPIFLAVMRKNQFFRERKLTEFREKRIVDFQPWGTLRFHLSTPRRSLRKGSVTEGGTDVRLATSADIPAIIEFWNERRRDTLLAPQFSLPLFMKTLYRSSGLQIGDFLLVTDSGGRIQGMMALWDQCGLRRIRVTRLSSWLRRVAPLWNGTAGELGLFRIPKEGEVLRLIHGTLFCVRNNVAADLLLDRARQETYRRGAALLIVGTDARDPVNQTLSRHSVSTETADLFIDDPEGGLRERARTALFQAEPGLG